MPPKNRPSTGSKKTKKADDSEEFQAFLSQLQKASKHEDKTVVQGASVGAKKGKDSAAPANELAAVKKASAGEHPLEKMLEQQQRQRQLQAFIQQVMAQRSVFLPSPNTQFHHESKVGKHFSTAAGAMQGWRAQMEDAHIIDVDFVADKGCGLFCVFDGHAGAKCAAMNKALIPVLARKHMNEQQTKVDFHTAFLELDSAMRAKGLPDDSGSTAVCVLVTPTHVTCASVGDSRAVLCRGGRAIALSEDHKPENEAEKARIVAAGGHVENNRVNGQLAMSRAIGDFSYKANAALPPHEQLVIHVPDVVTHERTAEDSFVVVACDGIFDVLSNDDVIAFVHQHLQEDPNRPLHEICERMCQLCLAPAGANGQPARSAGTDNMTVVITKLL